MTLRLTFRREGPYPSDQVTAVVCKAEYGRFFESTLQAAADMLNKFTDIKVNVEWMP